MEAFKAFVKKYMGAICGTAAGLTIAVLFLVIGFFPTLLLLILGGLGAAIGGVPEVRHTVAGWFLWIFRKITGKND